MFPKFKGNKSRYTIILFLTTHCSSCIEILNKLQTITSIWKEFDIILFIDGDKSEFKEIANRNSPNALSVRYTLKDHLIFKTEIFPFLYYISPENIIVSKGAVDSDEDMISIINNKTKS